MYLKVLESALCSIYKTATADWQNLRYQFIAIKKIINIVIILNTSMVHQNEGKICRNFGVTKSDTSAAQWSKVMGVGVMTTSNSNFDLKFGLREPFCIRIPKK